jgi:hypothetical protein
MALLEMYFAILGWIRTGRETIAVPLLPNEFGNALQQIWEITLRIDSVFATLEEVVAVWVSLKRAENDGYIDKHGRDFYEYIYKNMYENMFEDFSIIYDFLNSSSSHISFHHVVMALNISLTNENPIHSFIIDVIPHINHLIDKDRHIHLKYKHLHHLVGSSADLVNDYIKRRSQRPGYGNIDAFFKLPRKPMFCLFNEHAVAPLSGVIIDRGIRFWLESIRQQLATGEGLLCPFWSWGQWAGKEPEHCCRIYRDDLERVWAQTKPVLSCTSWRPCGCLSA